MADALEYLAAHGREYDAIHASPPCQGYSVMHNLPWLRGRPYPCGARFRTVAGAQVHFGRRPSEPVGCSIDVEDYRVMRYELHAARVKLIRMEGA